VTIFARTLSGRRLLSILTVLCAASASATLALGAAPARALVEEVNSAKFGVQPRVIGQYYEGALVRDGLNDGKASVNPGVATFANPTGQPVLHAARTYVVFWDAKNYYHADWKNLIEAFTHNLGEAGGRLDNVFAVDTQYTDTTNQPATSHFAFHGAVVDTNPYPLPGCTDPHAFSKASEYPFYEELGTRRGFCLTDAQLRTELETVIAQHSLPTGMETVFYLLTPPGVAVCLDEGGSPGGHCSDFAGEPTNEKTALEVVEQQQKEEADKLAKKEAYVAPEGLISYRHSFCSYHDVFTSGGKQVVYGVIPWTAGGAGDYQLALADETSAYDCQDGGFEPPKKSTGELQIHEEEKEETLQEKEEFEKKSTEEKRKALEAKELGLAGPHEQEPNQLTSTPSEDGAHDTGLADLLINQIAVEQQNIVTDPLLNGWQDAEHKEVTDECRNRFVSGKYVGSSTANPETLAGTLANETLDGVNYYLNNAFNKAGTLANYPGIECLGGVNLVPRVTSPNPVNSGETVGFDGMASNVTFDAAVAFTGSGTPTITYPTYTWDFGDGTPVVTGYAPALATVNSPGATPCSAEWLSPCAGSTFHSYQYGGTYTVTLTVRDTAGDTASTTRTITVVGPPPPPASGAGGGSTTTSTVAGSSTESSGASPSPLVVPAPVATAAVATRTLHGAARSGLLVRYSVNEQVAGHFEVLLSKSLAKRLGISGHLAAGLPRGTAPQVIVGRALLVTTKGGRNTVKIVLSKRTISRLERLRKVTLMLRLFVRNAASHSPLTTTVISTATLTR
jgi:hypothetical protein